MSGPRRAGAQRRIERKVERLQKYASPAGECAGKNAQDYMREDLDDAMRKYLEVKESGALYTIKTKRGIVRGLAMGLARVRWTSARTEEQESLRRVRND